MQRILPHMHDLLEGLNARVPVTVFAKGGSHFLKDLSTLPCTTLGLDWQTDRRWARALADAAPGGPKVLQGNLDPSVLYANPGIIRAETHRMIDGWASSGPSLTWATVCTPTSRPTTAGHLSKR